VSTNGAATASVPLRSITAFAPASLRERRKGSGRSGARWRDSISAKAASNAAEPARRRSVWASSQPVAGASTSA
jgi:hypothetical protein